MEEKILKIYFTSDIHGYVFPTDYRGTEECDIGLFKCVNQFHKDGNTLFIDGGDVLQGSPLCAFCHDSIGEASQFAEIMNCCGYDYVTLGNHDFNYGMEYLDSYLNALKARCVCQNAAYEDGTVRFPSRIHVLENGLRIGIVGIVTDYVNVWEKPEHLTGLKISNPLEAAKEALQELRGNVDITVCIYHGGFERDLETGRILSNTTENIAYQLCEALEFDILLTGHQHMSITGQMVSGTFIVQPPDWGKSAVSIEATVSNGQTNFKSEILPAGGACDPYLLKKFGSMELGAQGWLDVVVGHLDKPLLPSPPLIMAAEGSEMATFFNEVQLAASGAELSATSLANETWGLPQMVKRRDVLIAYPYTNTLTVLRVTGKALREAMERSAEYFDLDEDRQLCVSETFLKPKVEHYNYDYFSGVDYVVDVSRPHGKRITALLRKGKPVLDEDEFTICLNSYRASGTGGYPSYVGCPIVKEINTEISDLILGFFEKNPSLSIETKKNFQVIF